jgi:hypothetical protein
VKVDPGEQGHADVDNDKDEASAKRTWYISLSFIEMMPKPSINSFSR